MLKIGDKVKVSVELPGRLNRAFTSVGDCGEIISNFGPAYWLVRFEERRGDYGHTDWGYHESELELLTNPAA